MEVDGHRSQPEVRRSEYPYIEYHAEVRKRAGTELRATLPIRRVVGPADIAALAVHIMTNTALTGATYDIDGGQQLVAG
jgi:hypothetical protein